MKVKVNKSYTLELDLEELGTLARILTAFQEAVKDHTDAKVELHHFFYKAGIMHQTHKDMHKEFAYKLLMNINEAHANAHE